MGLWKVWFGTGLFMKEVVIESSANSKVWLGSLVIAAFLFRCLSGEF